MCRVTLERFLSFFEWPLLSDGDCCAHSGLLQGDRRDEQWQEALPAAEPGATKGVWEGAA